MRGFGVVFTPPVSCKGIAIASKRNTLTLGFHPNLMSVTMKKIATTKTVAIPRKRSWLMGSSCTTSSPSLGRHAQSLHRAMRTVDLVAVKLTHWDEVLCKLCKTLDIFVLLFFWLLGNLLADSWSRSDLCCCAQGPKYFHVWCALPP